MWFGVLGPVEVRGDDGAAVRLPPGRSQVLLALLVDARPHPAGFERLLGEIWPDGTGTRAALQVLVHRLRRRLGPDRVLLEPGGYRLRAETAEVDAEAFEAVLRGRGSAQDARAREASLGEALRLWRGEPYTPWAADSPTLALGAARLRETYLDGVTARFSAALDAGRSGDLVGDLVAAVAEHPLHEGLAAQLMLALYRAGRTADALETYRTTRALLVEELGVEPGATIRDLEHAILTEDAALSAPPAAVRHRDVARPAELPPRDPAFAGRDGDVAELVACVRRGGVVTVDGPGGVGKSALAIEVAHAVAEEFDGGVLYVNLRGATPGVAPRDPAVVLERFVAALGGATSSDLDRTVAEYRTRTAATRVLVVLDDAASATQVRQLVPAGGSAVVVTSRPVLGGLGRSDARRHLDVLSPADALEVLAGLVGPERVGAEPEAAARIVAACAHLPLAVRIAGARLAATPARRLGVFADRLDDSQARLDELALDEVAVRSSLAVGLEALDDDGRRLFALLGLVGLTWVTPAAAARLADLPLGVARRRLDDLALARLLDVDAEERYRWHDLVRLVGREHADARLAPEERRLAVRRLYAHYLASAQSVARATNRRTWAVRFSLVPPVDPAGELAVEFADGAAAAGWARSEIGNVEAVADAALAHGGDRTDVAALLTPLTVVLKAKMMYAVADRLFLPFTSARPPLTRADVLMLFDAASVGTDPEVTLGYGERALAGARTLGDGELAVAALDQIGSSHLKAGRLEAALSAQEEGLSLALAGRFDHTVPVVRANMAKTVAALGRYEDAIALYAADLDRVGDLTRAQHLVGIAVNHRRAGRSEQALPLYEEGVAEFRRLGISSYAALYLWNHANALDAVGRSAHAREKRWDSLELLIELGRITREDADEVMRGEPPEDLPAFDGM